MAQEPFVIIAETATSPKHYIQPKDFDIEGGGALGSTFGKSEVETTAGRLIAFFQSRGCWTQFKIEELVDFYKLKGWDTNTMFFGLIGGWYDDNPLYGWSNPYETMLGFDAEGHCYITDLFLKRCSRHLKKKVA